MALLIEKTVAEVIQAVRLNGTIWVQTNWGSGSIKVAKSAALAELSRLPLVSKLQVIDPPGADLLIICGTPPKEESSRLKQPQALKQKRAAPKAKRKPRRK